MASAATSKKARRSRPVSTSALSQPAVEDSSSITSLSAFSPRGDLFAFISLAVDKHRLRVYDTATGQSVAQYIIDAARVTVLSWTHFDPSEAPNAATDDGDAAPKRKRKKRASMNAEQAEGVSQAAQVVVLGLSNGSLLVFSPSHGRVLRSLSHPSSTSPILSLDVSASTPNAVTIWTSGADGQIRVWDAQKSDHLSSTKTDDRIPGTSLSLRPNVAPTDEEAVAFLLAHHSIRLLASPATSLSAPSKPKVQTTFTGHASNIVSLKWHPTQSEGEPPRQFASIAEADRYVYLWDIPQSLTTEGKLVASAPLDSDARHISFSESSPNATLLVLSASGRIAIFAPSADLASSKPSKKSKEKVVTLNPRSTINISLKQNTASVKIVAASFVHGEEGRIRVARLAGGVKPVFEFVQYLDESGVYIPDINVVHNDASAGLTNEDDTVTGAPNQRYAESTSLSVRSGVELGQDASADDLVMRDVNGDLNVDLAELSLGQRLTALDPSVAPARADDSDAPSDAETSSRRKQGASTGPPSSITLTRTLIQALHSSDTKLLETCLTHTDASLILNTVRRLPPQLAVPLLNACVERLGRGKGGGTGNGRGGGAGSQRAAGLLKWVKTVLAVHSAHLMTMPDLVARLSSLHATLTTRLALHESLLTLSGRLDMVLQQIELRSTAKGPLAEPIDPQGKKTKGKASAIKQREPQRYVEGESEEEEGGLDAMDVEVEEGSDVGSVEDVELGAESGSENLDSEEEYDEEDSEEDDEGEDGAPRLNGFIDDEAEEFDEDGSEDESD